MSYRLYCCCFWCSVINWLTAVLHARTLGSILDCSLYCAVGCFGLWSAWTLVALVYGWHNISLLGFYVMAKKWLKLNLRGHALSNEGLIATKTILIALPRLHRSYPSVVLFSDHCTKKTAYIICSIQRVRMLLVMKGYCNQNHFDCLAEITQLLPQHSSILG